MNVKKLLFFLYLSLSLLVVQAQKSESSLQFDGIFDNREYFSEYGFPQTIFGVRFDAQLNFKLDSIRGVRAGINYFFENGSEILEQKPVPDLYYYFKKESFKYLMGSFPASERLNYPLALLNDTLRYYRPNIQGMLFRVDQELLLLEAFLDWTGRVTEERRESFLVGVISRFQPGHIFVQSDFLMYHHAHSYARPAGEAILDNGIFMVEAGYEKNFASKQASIMFSGAYMASYRRERPSDFEWGYGPLVQLHMTYSIFGLKGVYYFGTPIYFDYGDPFYRAGKYGRFDFYLDPFKGDRVSSKLAWNLHLVPGEGLHHSQQVLLSVRF